MRKMQTCILLFAILLLATAPASAEEGRPWYRIDVSDEAIEYSGAWSQLSSEGAYRGLEQSTPRQTAYAEYTFEGTGVRIAGSSGPTRGIFNVYLNDELIAEVDTYSETIEYQTVFFEEVGLEEGMYTLRIDPTGEAREGVPIAQIVIDFIEYQPLLGEWIETLMERIESGREMAEGIDLEKPSTIGDDLKGYFVREDRDAFLAVLDEAQSLLDDDLASSSEIVSALERIDRAQEELLEQERALMVPDRSGNGHHGEIYGQPRWVPGMFGKSILFDTEDSIELPPEAIPTGNKLTYELWNYGTTANPSGVIWAWEDEERHTRTFLVHLPWSDEVAYFDCGNEAGSYDRIFIDVSNKYQGWNHWAFTKNAESGNMKIYFNGELLHSGTELHRGINPSVAAVISQNHHGAMDEVRLWDIERTQEEIQETMLAPLHGDEEGLVGYWNFETITTAITE